MHVYHFGFLVIIIPVAQQGPEHETEAIFHSFEGLISSPRPASSQPLASLRACALITPRAVLCWGPFCSL